MYELRVDKQAAKYLKKLDKPNRKRLMVALTKLAENPFLDTSVTRLKGYTSTFRKRVGDFRIIFEVDQGDLIVLVLKIGSRGDIYKK
jgi:mRNA interferase RelE/StbE